MLSRETLVNALLDLRRATVRGHRAPYKPLTLLWALGRIWRDSKVDRLVEFQEARVGVVPLFEQFGRGSNHSVNPVNPLWRLQGDGDGSIWECRASGPVICGADGIPTSADLTRTSAHFGFALPTYELLVADIPLRLQAGQVLASQVCPLEIWPELFEATGIPFDGTASNFLIPVSTGRTREIAGRVARSPQFRVGVLEAYGHRCAVCSTSPQVGERRFGVEAAHIQWVTEEGPDEVQNGLALCVMHHRGFDRGAFTLTDTLDIHVSPRLQRPNVDTPDHFWYFDRRPISRPSQSNYQPKRDFIEWHRREVFAST